MSLNFLHTLQLNILQQIECWEIWESTRLLLSQTWKDLQKYKTILLLLNFLFWKIVIFHEKMLLMLTLVGLLLLVLSDLLVYIFCFNSNMVNMHRYKLRQQKIFRGPQFRESSLVRKKFENCCNRVFFLIHTKKDTEERFLTRKLSNYLYVFLFLKK